VSTGLGGGEAVADREGLGAVLPERRERTVVVHGPAMTGKRALAVGLLVDDVVETDGRAFYVSTSDTAESARGSVLARVPEGVDIRDPVVVDATRAGGPGDSDYETGTTFRVDAPGDVTGIGLTLSKLYDGRPRSERLGSRVLVDNAAAMLLGSDVETVCRFVHALGRFVTDAGGGLIVTLDTDGLSAAERRQILSLFDTTVEVRKGGDPAFRVDSAEDWHPFDLHGGI
jgi:hypothetical protein